MQEPISDQCGLDPELVVIERGHLLAEALGDAVETVGLQLSGVIQMDVLLVESDGVAGSGEENAWTLLLAGGFVEIVEADDVGVQDLGEALLTRDAAQMQHTVAAGNQGADSLEIAQVALLYDLLAVLCRL